MTVGSSDLLKAINSAWDVSTLDATFKAYWDDPTETEFYVLNDQEAPGQQPWPYVVMDQPDDVLVERHSADGDSIKREIRDVEVRFNVHVEVDAGSTKSAREVASDLTAAILAVFGGHPSTSPTGTITLDNGKHLITQYQTDYGIRTGDDEYQWVVVYLFRVDIPVAV